MLFKLYNQYNLFEHIYFTLLPAFLLFALDIVKEPMLMLFI